jgi:predicted methyltransferase MtxX (methanogen marker protein 4)
MGNKRNQVIAIARFLAYKAELNKQIENMSEEQYMQNPVGLDVGQYVEDMMKYCTEQNEMIARLGMEYLSAIAFMPYIDGGETYAGQQA